uniref:Uncharacterized protein n=1 Tax=Parascaris equorum TaxID=6256 RepID=A0A914S744_PAREQ
MFERYIKRGGVFFSTLTLIVAVSTTFTITVLNLRYRQSANCEMSATVCILPLRGISTLFIENTSSYNLKLSR